jgi:hypothetical protein
MILSYEPQLHQAQVEAEAALDPVAATENWLFVERLHNVVSARVAIFQARAETYYTQLMFQFSQQVAQIPSRWLFAVAELWVDRRARVLCSPWS